MSAPGDSSVTVGLDIGTSSVKAVAADADGNVLARTRVSHRARTPAPGYFEHDVDEAWRANVLTALADVATGRDVAAVNVSAMVPSLGALDADGGAVGPGLLYGDRRGTTNPADVDEPGNAGELLAFLEWHAGSSPGAAHFWPAQAVANHALCGRGAIDFMTAATAYPLFDYRAWDATLAEAAGVDVGALPEIIGSDAAVGTVRAGLPAEGAVVGGGTVDALAEQLVAGAEDVGDVLVLCGSTLLTWGVLADAADVPGLWTIPHTAPGKSLIGGPSNAGGLFIERARAWLGEHAAAGMADVGPDDLPIWLPYARGERVPFRRPDLTASLHGAAFHHTSSHLLRAAYEAAGFVVRRNIELAAGAGLAPERIVATGGGTNVEVWMRSLADCTGLPVDVAAVPEGAALGAAFLARWAAGLETDMGDARRWARTERRVEPDPAWQVEADGRYQRFLRHTEAVLAE